MIGVFAYLTGRSLRNRLVRQLRQVRNPRYLLALLLGLAYLTAVLANQRASGPAPDPAAEGRWLELLAAVGIAGAVAWAWAFGLERRVLAFSPAEVTFLFAAPVTRRQLVQFKLLRAQSVILFNAVLWTVLLARDRGGPPPWLRAIGIWTLLSTLMMHRVGASFVRTSLAEHGWSGVRHRVASLALLGLALIATVWSVAGLLPDLIAVQGAGVGAWLAAIGAAAEAPVPSALLYPFRLVARPLVAADARAWVMAMGPAVVVLALHYVWVIRADAAFEEAAAESALLRAAALRARGEGGAGAAAAERGRRSGAIFPLAPSGAPAVAIVWKNLLAVLRLRRMRNAVALLVVAGAAVAIASFGAAGGVAEMVGTLAAIWGLGLVIAGPQWVRNDLRNDLRKLDLLRTYPVRGAAIVAAETAGSAIVLTAIEYALLLLAYFAFLGHDSFAVGLGGRTALLAAAAILLPALNYAGLLLHNGAALLYPAWVTLGTGRPGGVEALGQNLLTLLAFALLLGAVAAVPVGLGAGVWYLLRGAGWIALVPAAAVAAAALLAEARAIVEWLGDVFERTDVTATGIDAG